MTFVYNLKLVRTNKPGPTRCWEIMLRDEKACCLLASWRETTPNNCIRVQIRKICLLTQPKSNIPSTVFRLLTVNQFDNCSILDEFLRRCRRLYTQNNPFS